MVCTHCGTVAEPASHRCAVCDSEIPPVGDGSTRSPDTDSDALTAAAATATSVPDTSDRPAPLLQAGQKFGTRYTVIKRIGEGGMGAVYHAWDESLGIPVALKLIKMDAGSDPSEVRQVEARFKRELLLARQITHPNVVRIHDLGELGETKYLTMAYVPGADLATTLGRDGKFPVARALAIARQIAAGLAAAHEAGVVHRDLKPANVLIDAEDRALLTDFGIARRASRWASGPRTRRP